MLGLILVLGLTSFFYSAYYEFRSSSPFWARGPLWEARGPNDQPLIVAHPKSLTLSSKSKILFDEEGKDLTYKSISFWFQNKSESTFLKLTLREKEDGSRAVRSSPVDLQFIGIVVLFNALIPLAFNTGQ